MAGPLSESGAENTWARLKAYVNGELLVQSQGMPLSKASDLHLFRLGELAQSHLGADALLQLEMRNIQEPCTVELGRGTYGVVRRVCSVLRTTDHTCHGCVALKREKWSDVRHELNTVARLTERDPTLATLMPKMFGGVPLQGKATSSSPGILIMESVTPFAPGGRVSSYPSVQNLAKRAPLALVQNVLPRVVKDVITFLARAQKAIPGFRHNDLSPSNVLLAPGDAPGEARTKIIDFGLAWAPNGRLPNPIVDQSRIIARNATLHAWEEHVLDEDAREVRLTRTVEPSRPPSEIERASILPIPSQFYDIVFFVDRVVDTILGRDDSDDFAPFVSQLWKQMETILGPQLAGMGDHLLATAGPFPGRMTVKAQLAEWSHPEWGIPLAKILSP